MGNWMRHRHVSVTLIALLTVCVTCSSCETLRKKFTRQKKKGQTENTDFIPVLEPQDYPAPEYNAAENYKEHYALIRVWYKDLQTNLVEKEDSDGRVKYALRQINSHLDGMITLLNDEKKPLVEKLRGSLKNYTEALKTSRETRNRSRLQSDLREFDHILRHDLRLDVVKKDLIKLEPPH